MSSHRRGQPASRSSGGSHRGKPSSSSHSNGNHNGAAAAAAAPGPKNIGIVQLSFAYLFEQIKRRKLRDKTLYVITVSYLEIYNEQVGDDGLAATAAAAAVHSLLPSPSFTIFLTCFSHSTQLYSQVLDLLNPSPRCLNVRWAKDRGFYAENLFKVECEDIGDLEGVLEEGKSRFVVFVVVLCSGSGVLSEIVCRCRCESSVFGFLRVCLHTTKLDWYIAREQPPAPRDEVCCALLVMAMVMVLAVTVALPVMSLVSLLSESFSFWCVCMCANVCQLTVH